MYTVLSFLKFLGPESAISESSFSEYIPCSKTRFHLRKTQSEWHYRAVVLHLPKDTCSILQLIMLLTRIEPNSGKDRPKCLLLTMIKPNVGCMMLCPSQGAGARLQELLVKWMLQQGETRAAEWFEQH